MFVTYKIQTMLYYICKEDNNLQKLKERGT